MGTLHIHFAGVCAYVPRADFKGLQVLMPNGTRAAGGPITHLDGTPAKVHRPVFFEFSSKVITLIDPKTLLHSRLSFSIVSTDGSNDFSKVKAGSQDWLDVAGRLWKEPLKANVAALAYLDRGSALLRKSPCSTIWSPSSSWGLDRVMPGVSVTITNAQKVALLGRPFGSEEVPKELYARTVGTTEVVELALGNLCGDKCLAWNDPLVAGESRYDDDFKSIYWLSKSREVQLIAAGSRPLPRPQSQVATRTRKIPPLGLSGCECNGYVSAPADL